MVPDCLRLRTRRIARATPLVASVCAVLILAVRGCTRPVTPEQLHPLFEEALVAEGDDYLNVRDQVVGLGRGAVPLLREIASEAKTWEERCLADILIDRINHWRQPTVTEREWEQTDLRSFRRRIERRGQLLARKFAKRPMALVEHLWKRIPTIPPLQYHFPRASYAFALGCLRESRARLAIEAAVSDAIPRGVRHFYVVWAGAYALGELGCRESAPLLLRVCNTCSSRLAERALLLCLRSESAHVWAEYAAKAKSPRIKQWCLKEARERADPAQALLGPLRGQESSP